ncbi:hypothetical protein GCM10011579_041840 [Streptomyces albiflavescens]|uniref:C4-dicarboxylate ABC transporter substrate-binding protein n=1 Tax=Streptomyces albiflavescens TaxID=1623582 RepID=A0A918D698_9ACTN|nr:TRAP transporter substrate-binding protein DctP [Streptomyces albiflavescens]GGN68392.1 hypothetical protein GCM10011579_041840 [Streptomyces albiflavescens]
MRARRTATSGALSAVVGLVLLAATGCSGSAAADKAGGHSAAKPVELTLATPMGTSEEFDSFLLNVKLLSHGSIRIRVETDAHHQEGPDFETRLLDDVRQGRVDLAALGSRAFDSTGARALRALTAPLLITGYDAEEKVLAAPVARRMVREIDGDGLTAIGLLPGTLRRPLGARTALLGPADYKGRTIGEQQSEVADATLRALGAKPVAFAAGGSVDAFGGYEQQLASVDGNRYDKNGMIASANVVLWPRPVALVAGTKAFQRLSGDQQDALRKAGQQAVSGSAAVLRSHEKESVGNLCRRGQKFAAASPSQLASLRKAVQPVYDELARDRRTKEYLDAITSLVRNIPAEPTVSCKGMTSTVD